MKKISVLIAAAAATFATPAFAQDEEQGSFFIGGLAGVDIVNTETGGGEDFDESGIVYGVTASYDLASGPATFGVEAEITNTSLNEDLGDAGVDIYGGVRLGYMMDENDTIYIKAGYTNVDTPDLVENLEGFRVGAGFEHNFGVFTSRFEYRYSGYDFDAALGDVNGNRHQFVVVLGGRF